jgi:putative membrane protein
MRKLKDYFVLFVKGIAMGGADVVPGVSGGTIAFITGIYEELLDSINAIDLKSLKLLASVKLKQFWKVINGNFLLSLFSGIMISLFSLAKLIGYLIEFYPVHLWSFFLGLIMASTILVLKKIRKWNIGVVLSMILGTIIAFIITISAPADTGDSLITIFFSGMIAICAMILPGISGSFILLILGKYEMIINAVNELKITVLIVFALGCGIGLALFSRIIAWVLHRYHNIAIGVLAGFMVGSLNKIWPWKEVLQFRIDSHGEQVPIYDRSIMPNQYFELTGEDPHFLQALLFTCLGIFIVVLFDRIASWALPKN